MLRPFLYTLATVGALNCLTAGAVANSVVTSSMGNFTYVDTGTGGVYPHINKNKTTATFIPENSNDPNYGWTQSVQPKSPAQLPRPSDAQLVAPAPILAPAQNVAPAQHACYQC